MNNIREFLARARSQGQIDVETEQKLGKFVDQQAAKSGEPEDRQIKDPNHGGREQQPQEEERGLFRFLWVAHYGQSPHVIVVTEGIVLTVLGLLAFTWFWITLVAIFILAEIFVRRKRIALPGLTLAMLLVTVVAVSFRHGFASAPYGAVKLFGAEIGTLTLYYFRYRMPFSLAALICCTVGFLFAVVLAVVSGGLPLAQAIAGWPRLAGFLGLIASISLFGVALWFDFEDRKRVANLSMVPFWLFLITPIILHHAVFFVAFGDAGHGWGQNPRIDVALLAILMIVFLAVIGLIVDRTGFFTSGMLSLGMALGMITRELSLNITHVTAAATVAVGLILLMVGPNWHALRNLLLPHMPKFVLAKVPPAR